MSAVYLESHQGAAANPAKQKEQKAKAWRTKDFFHRLCCRFQKLKELCTENDQVIDNKNDNLVMNKLIAKLKVAEKLMLQLLQSNYSQPKFFLKILLTDRNLCVTKIDYIGML